MQSYEKRTWWTRHRLGERLAHDAFREAAITGAFLVAAADGNASEVEYDALLDRLQILGDVDRDTIDAILTAAAKGLEADGFAPLIARIGELVRDGDPADAGGEAIMMLALAIALADDTVTAEEREVATQLATGLGLAGVDLDAMLAELHG